MKQPDTMAEPNFLGSAIVSGCFISSIYWRYRFLLQFPTNGLHDWGYFIGYSFVIPRNKASTVSYDTAFFKAVFIGKDADFSPRHEQGFDKVESCLLYTSDAADEL